MKKQCLYEVSRIFALNYEDEGWIYNDSMTLGYLTITGETTAEQDAAALLDWIREHGYTIADDWKVNDTTGDALEVTIKETGEPLFLAELCEEILVP